MSGNIITFLRRWVPVLFEKEMPVWLTIVASLVAAMGAYYISPAINRQFQINDARSAHLSRTTDNLNEEIIALSTKVRRLNEALVNDPTKAQDLRGDCLDLVTKLQWMLVDLRVVLVDREDRAAVDRLANAIGGVKAALDIAIDKRAQPKLLLAMRELGEQTSDVLDRLYVKASLKESCNGHSKAIGCPAA